MWISAGFTLAGAVLMLVVAWLTLHGAVRAARAESWAQRPAGETYVSYAWGKLGRGLFLGYLFTLGLSPVTAFFFLGHDAFWKNFFFLSLINWGLSAIVIYFVQLLPGFRGYVIEQGRRGTLAGVSLYGQLLIVTAMSAPLIYIFFALLLPPAREFFQVLFETWRLYTRIYM